MTRRAILIGALIASLTLALTNRTLRPVRLAVGAVLYPLAAPFTGATHSLRSIVSTVSQIKDLQQEAVTLRSQNQTLEAQVAQLAALRSENDALQTALKFQTDHPEATLVSAHVIARSPDSFQERLIIDRGKVDQLNTGAPVIVDGFLVGVLSDVSAHQATVKLITASDSAVAVVFVNSRAQGLLRGGLNGLVASEVALDTKVMVGEPVVTSSLGGVLPADIPVGQAHALRSLPSDILQEISIETPVKLSTLELVFVGQPVGP